MLPSSHHLPRLALLFAGGVILVYLMNEIKMLLLLKKKKKKKKSKYLIIGEQFKVIFVVQEILVLS